MSKRFSNVRNLFKAEKSNPKLCRIDFPCHWQGHTSPEDQLYMKNNLHEQPRKQLFEKNIFFSDLENMTVLNQRTMFRGFVSFGFLLVGLYCDLYLSDIVYLSSFFYLLAIITGGYTIIRKGFLSILALRINLYLLMFISLIGLIFLGNLLEGALFVLLYTIFEIVERYAIHIAKKAMDQFTSLLPLDAVVERGKELHILPLEQVEVNDIVIVDVGEQIPVDGILTSGEATVDERVITGKSYPIHKKAGNQLFAGSINKSEKISLRVNKKPQESIFAQMIAFVKQAQRKKAPAQHFIESFIAYYTPIVILLALFIAVMPPLVVNALWEKWIYLGLATLVVASPGALIISIPISFILSLKEIAKRGVLIKEGRIIEDLSRIKGIAFDQVGTLTLGRMNVTDFLNLSKHADKTVIELVASLCNSTAEPFGKALMLWAKKQNIEIRKDIEIHTVKDQQVTGTFNGQAYQITYYKHIDSTMLDNVLVEQLQGWKDDSKALAVVTSADRLIALFALEDEIRPEAAQVIQQLKRKRMEQLFLLTEQKREIAKKVAETLEITKVYANLVPNKKSSILYELSNNYAYIAYVSSCENLEKMNHFTFTGATVHMVNNGRENNLASARADIVFLQDDLSFLPTLIDYSRKTMRIIKSNLFIAFILKLVALLLIIPNILTVWMALSIDIVATVFIVSNVLRLQKIR